MSLIEGLESTANLPLVMRSCLYHDQEEDIAEVDEGNTNSGRDRIDTSCDANQDTKGSGCYSRQLPGAECHTSRYLPQRPRRLRD